MKSVQIKLKLAEHVKSFVQKVAMFPGELDLRSGRYVVDAKAYLVFSVWIYQSQSHLKFTTMTAKNY